MNLYLQTGEGRTWGEEGNKKGSCQTMASNSIESLVLLVFPGEVLPTFVPISAIENFAEQRYQICSISTNMLASKCNRPLCYPLGGKELHSL